MGKKDRESWPQQREQFVDGLRGATAIDATKAERVWDKIEQFAGYGFNKCHAAAYGLVAYQTAYLKANYPVEFMAALLTSEMDDTDKIVKYIEECRAMGIRVRAARRQRVADRSSRVAADAIHFGLAAIKNVGRRRDRVDPRRAPRPAPSRRSRISARASICGWSTGA